MTKQAKPVEKPSEIFEKPSETIENPSRTAEESSRTAEESSRNVREPSRTAEESFQAATEVIEEQQTPEDIPNEFEPGAFDEPEPQPEPEDKNTDSGAGLTVTYMVNSLVRFVASIFLDEDEVNSVCLTDKQIRDFEDMERRCGVSIQIDSPWFYFTMLAIPYGNIMLPLIQMKLQTRKELKAAKEKAAKEAKKETPITEHKEAA